MTSQQIIEWFGSNDIRLDTISFYSTKDACVDDWGVDCDVETSFGYCDITGKRGTVVPCTCLTATGEVYEFEALESLVGDTLGRLGGAF